MQRIEPARLKPGVDPATITTTPEARDDARESRTIRGKALIFWDPKRPERKLDAIDTDQITPAADRRLRDYPVKVIW